MLTEKQVREMLAKYPDGVNKEIFRKVCHVSPQTAQYLLESQLVPCQISPQKTHRYHIATADMIAYLQDREKHPGRYGCPNGRAVKNRNLKKKKNHAVNRPSARQLMAVTTNDYQKACQHALCDLPDVMTIQQVKKVIGYSEKTIYIWCKKRRLFSIRIRCHSLVPKVSLYEFMVSKGFQSIKNKSVSHWGILSYAVKLAAMDK